MAGTSFAQAVAALKLDLSSLNAGKAHLEDFAKKGHAWFEHVGSSGRAFHKVLEKITEASPLLGSALKLAIDPIVGTLAAATIAFSYFQKKLEEWNKEMDEAAANNAKRIGMSKEQIEEMDIAHTKAMTSLRAWVNEMARVHNQAAKDLERELHANERLAEVEQLRLSTRKQLATLQVTRDSLSGAMLPAEAQAKLATIEREAELEKRKIERSKIEKDIASVRRAKGGVDYQLAFSEPLAVASSMATEDLGDRLKKSQEVLRNLREQEADAAKRVKTLEEQKKATDDQHPWRDALLLSPRAMQTAASWRPPPAKQLEEYTKALNAHQAFLTAIEKESKNVKKLAAEHDDAADKTKKLQEKVGELSNESYDFKNRMDTLRRDLAQPLPTQPHAPGSISSPITMSLDSLSQYNTPYGAVARRIQLAQQIAGVAAAAGRFGLAQNLLRYIHGGNFRQGQNVAGEMGDVRSRFADYMAHPEKGLESILPPGLTEEGMAKQRQTEMINALSLALKVGDKGLPVVINDIAN